MSNPKELLRNHLLAATMVGRWETLTEMKHAICKESGHRLLRSAVWTWVLELSHDGVHTLDFRRRADSRYKEYRLYVKPEKVMATREFVRTPMARRS